MGPHGPMPPLDLETQGVKILKLVKFTNNINRTIGFNTGLKFKQELIDMHGHWVQNFAA
jgi:hypothetical protein